MPLWGDRFGCCDGKGFFLEGVRREHASVANDYSDDEKRAREVAEEGQEPVLQHFQDGGTAVERRECGILDNSHKNAS